MRRDGTSQPERFPVALAEDYVQIDERSHEDVMNFIRRLAEEFNFYNASNQIDGDWTTFFEDDLSFLLARILEIDLDLYRESFEDRYAKVADDVENLQNALPALDFEANFSDLFEWFLTDISTPSGDLTSLPYLLDAWHAQLPEVEEFSGVDSLFSLKDEISEMRGKLSRFMVRLELAHYETEDQVGGLNPINANWYEALHEEWGFDVNPPTLSSPLVYYPTLDVPDGAEEVLSLIRGVYDTFIGIFRQLVSRIPDYMEQSLTAYQFHNPQNALFLAFMQLFDSARDHLNSLGRKHLLYHYEDVLRFDRQAAVPDQAALIFQLRKGVDRYVLPEDTLLKAGKDSDGKPLIYKTDREVALSQASIEAIQTVYVERNASSEVTGIYAAPIANSSDGQGADLDADEPKWNTFGEAQRPLSDENRTMIDAGLGFAIASPLFKMKEGKRKIYLTYKLDRTDNPLLAAMTDQVKAGIEADILYGLRAEVTGEKGWVDAQVGAVIVVRNTNDLIGHKASEKAFGLNVHLLPDNFLLGIRIDVDETVPAVVAYDEKLHAEAYETHWPMLKLTFDSQANQVSELGIPAVTFGAVGFNPYPWDSSKTTEDLGIYEGRIYRPKQNGALLSLSEFVPEDAFSAMQAFAYEELNLGSIYAPGQKIIFESVTYAATELAYAGNTPATHPEKWEVVDFSTSIYKHLEAALPQELIIKVDVSEVKGILLENDNGRLRSNKPFQPFGPIPVKGSRFYIGHQEALSKRLDYLSISVVWQDPAWHFYDHYAGYGYSWNSNHHDFNESFRAKTELLVDGKWSDLTPTSGGVDVPLFVGAHPYKQKIWAFDANSFAELERDLNQTETVQLQSNTTGGFIRLELSSPSQAFGHGLYQEKSLVEMLQQAKIIANNGTVSTNLLNPPYTPVIKEISLQYSSEEVLDFMENDTGSYNSRIEQFFHIHPFGHTEEHAALLDGERVTLVPAFREEGYLYLGIADLNPPVNASTTLSVLFQLAEGSADPELVRTSATWSFLADNRWIDLEPSEILFDSSNDLLVSGVVRFELGREISLENTLLDGKLHWMRASVLENTGAMHKAIDIKAQAILASFYDQENNQDHLRTALPSGTITGLKVNDASIKKVNQPYASFGGKLAEESDEFLTRVSERLRHKSRSINIWDYERMVLEQFPSVYKVKCLNHTQAQAEFINGADWEIAPGYVTIVTIPDLRNVNAVNPFEPKTSLNTLNEIEEFLGDHISTWVELKVTNPLYEKIQITCKVGFVEGKDPGFYIRELDTDLKRFLSPWAFDQEEDIVFGASMHRSVIINYIEQRDYVDFVVGFRMDQILSETETLVNVDEAKATTSRSILVSVLNHNISHVKSNEVICEVIPSVDATVLVGNCCNSGNVNDSGGGGVLSEEDSEPDRDDNLLSIS